MPFAALQSNQSIPRLGDGLMSMDLEGEVVGLEFRRSSRARRYILTLRANRTVLVTVPKRGSFERGREFLSSRLRWLKRALGQIPKHPPPTNWALGAEIWFRGRLTRIEMSGSANAVQLGTESFELNAMGADLRPQLEGSLRNRAAVELSQRVGELAALHQCSVRRIRIGNQRSRWGSCSSRGTLSLNWRLIQVPGEVRDYIIIHELMHLREMNHSVRFWEHVARACPNYRQYEGWLKAHPFVLNI